MAAPKRISRANTAIVIAAYNEEKRLPAVIAGVKKAGWSWIIVVDDGSRDKTALVAKKAGAQVILQRPNQGQGAALRTGIKSAVGEGALAVITYDADGQFIPSEIARVAEPVIKGRVDVVLGSRFKGRTVNLRFRKRVMLRAAILFTWLISRIKVTDTHNGFRCLSRKAAQTIKITFNRMEHASEIIDEVRRNKLSYAEVPVTIIYHEEGQHPMKSIGMGFRLLWWKISRRLGLRS